MLTRLFSSSFSCFPVDCDIEPARLNWGAQNGCSGPLGFAGRSERPLEPARLHLGAQNGHSVGGPFRKGGGWWRWFSRWLLSRCNGGGSGCAGGRGSSSELQALGRGVGVVGSRYSSAQSSCHHLPIIRWGGGPGRGGARCKSYPGAWPNLALILASKSLPGPCHGSWPSLKSGIPCRLGPKSLHHSL